MNFPYLEFEIWNLVLLLLWTTHSVILVTNGDSRIVSDDSLVESQDGLVSSLQPAHLTEVLMISEESLEQWSTLYWPRLSTWHSSTASLPTLTVTLLIGPANIGSLPESPSSLLTVPEIIERSDQVKSQLLLLQCSTLRVLRLTRPLLLTNLAVLPDMFWWRVCDPCMSN